MQYIRHKIPSFQRIQEVSYNISDFYQKPPGNDFVNFFNYDSSMFKNFLKMMKLSSTVDCEDNTSLHDLLYKIIISFKDIFFLWFISDCFFDKTHEVENPVLCKMSPVDPMSLMQQPRFQSAWLCTSRYHHIYRRQKIIHQMMTRFGKHVQSLSYRYSKPVLAKRFL